MAKRTNPPVTSPAFTIRFYLKAVPNRTKKPTKAQMKVLREALITSREPRADFLAAVESGEIHALKRIPSSCVRDAARRKRDFSGSAYCYTLTVADLGRAKTSAGTTAASFRAWIVKNLVPVGIFTDDEIAVVID